jgi:coenzyme F420 hydrogenase subunit beta
VFIGKPCDAAAVSLLRRKRPALDKKLGLVLTFFCAGTPCTQGTLDLLKRLEIPLEEVRHIRYRGNGWPGTFTVRYGSDELEKTLTYEESWGVLEKYRKSFRCHLCPDGLGELADISSGDAWHRYPGEKDRGRSLVIVRTPRGREAIRRAVTSGYLELVSSSATQVVAAQGLVKRRAAIFGRLLAMKALLVPTPRFEGFELGRSWHDTLWSMKLKSILGTIKRLLVRELWHKHPIANGHGDLGQRNTLIE